MTDSVCPKLRAGLKVCVTTNCTLVCCQKGAEIILIISTLEALRLKLLSWPPRRDKTNLSSNVNTLPGLGRYANKCRIVFPEEIFPLFILKAIFPILHWEFVYSWYKICWSTLNLIFVKVINYWLTILSLPDRGNFGKIWNKSLKNT